MVLTDLPDSKDGTSLAAASNSCCQQPIGMALLGKSKLIEIEKGEI